MDNYMKSLQTIIERDNSYLYSNEYDEYVHDELKRQQRVLFRSLDDFYWFGNTLNRDIEDIIYLDILNENLENDSEITKIKDYISLRMTQLHPLSFTDLQSFDSSFSDNLWTTLN